MCREKYGVHSIPEQWLAMLAFPPSNFLQSSSPFHRDVGSCRLCILCPLIWCWFHLNQPAKDSGMAAGIGGERLSTSLPLLPFPSFPPPCSSPLLLSHFLSLFAFHLHQDLHGNPGPYVFCVPPGKTCHNVTDFWTPQAPTYLCSSNKGSVNYLFTVWVFSPSPIEL